MLVATTLARINESTITRQKFTIWSKAVCITLLKSFKNLLDAKMRNSRKARTTRIAAKPCTNRPSHVSTKMSKMLTILRITSKTCQKASLSREEYLHTFGHRGLPLRHKLIQIIALLRAKASSKHRLRPICKEPQTSLRNVASLHQCDENTEKNQDSRNDIWQLQLFRFASLTSMDAARAHRCYGWTVHKATRIYDGQLTVDSVDSTNHHFVD